MPTICKRSVSLYCRNAYKVVYALVSNGANPELKPKPNAFKCAEMTALECAVKLGYDESEHAIEEGIKKFHKEVRLFPSLRNVVVHEYRKEVYSVQLHNGHQPHLHSRHL